VEQPGLAGAIPRDGPFDQRSFTVFRWFIIISRQPAALFSQNKSVTNNQPTVLFSQNKSASAISHQPNEQADCYGAAEVPSHPRGACFPPLTARFLPAKFATYVEVEEEGGNRQPRHLNSKDWDAQLPHDLLLDPQGLHPHPTI
jgi:hypothetical protein